MDLSKLSTVLADQPSYRYRQVNKFLFQDYISSWDEASSLPKSLREELAKNCPLEIEAEVLVSGQSKKSRKALIKLEDGELVETVLIQQKGKEVSKDDGGEGFNFRNTVCISSQVGCPLNCAFCATGQSGFTRNLSAEEIISQVVFWQRFLKQINQEDKVDNVVFMGMGEPFLNYAEFIKAAKFLNNPETINMGARRLSVSTAGVVDGIKRLAGEKLQMNLAISLHAANDNMRRQLMPIARQHSLKDLFKAIDSYITKTGRRVMFEYLMIKGINDSEADAEALAALMRQPLYLLNLIPYNETGRFQASPREKIEQFRKYLESKGVPVTVRLSFGADISAACGQLKNRQKKTSHV